MSESGIKQDCKVLAKQLSELPDEERKGALETLHFYLELYLQEQEPSHRLTARKQFP